MNAEDSLLVDNILRALNPLGRYQILHIIVVLLGLPIAGFQLFSNVFTAKSVPHQCAGPPEGSNWTAVFDKSGNFTVVQEECRLVLKENSSVLDSAPCVYGNEYELPRDASVVSQFHLVCDIKWLASFSQTVLILGQGVGGFLSTIFSDRCGRKAAFVGSNFGFLLSGLAVAYSPNVIVFIVLKFFIGGFQQGIGLSAAAYILELLPLEYRAGQSWLVGGTWGFGVVMFSIVSSFFKHHSWRYLQLAISLASVSAFLQWWYLDESLRWLLANGKTKMATKIIRRMARVNGQSDATVFEQLQHAETFVRAEAKEQQKTSTEEFAIEATSRLSLLDILKVRRLLLNSVCLWFGWFTAAISFFTIYLTATSLSGDPYLNFGLTALMEFPSNVFYFFYLNRLGRKRCMVTAYMTMGTGVVLAGMFKTLEKDNTMFTKFTLFASLVAMCGASGCFTIMFSYTPELFPTNLRTQAMGVSSFMGRIGGMLAPFASYLAEQAIWAPGVVIGICACLVCALSHFLPETTGHELPQTLPELHAWFKNKGAKDVNSRISSEVRNSRPV
ncbi:hypothetical protein RRG08_028224 [Elysia crispata]|uniref:Major facilitator superfamily (MFS) profile domain-containing protein n=1 Tax=Elysia crispata TaxID=231223 RepID=A0AAE1ARU5_9GAST|nr:hypothetical protein RRG08_028224 [Elysia crispata]